MATAVEEVRTEAAATEAVEVHTDRETAGERTEADIVAVVEVGNAAAAAEGTFGVVAVGSSHSVLVAAAVAAGSRVVAALRKVAAEDTWFFLDD